jgi:hypothetical protein
VVANLSSIRLARSRGDVAFAEQLRVDLAVRHRSVELTGFTTGGALECPQSATVAVVPQQDTDDHGIFLIWMDAVLSAGAAPVLIVPEGIDLPVRIHAEAAGIVFRNSTSYDQLFENLFRMLAGPFPSWLDVRVRPSLIQNPTGVAWWSDDLHVADDRFEHAVRISPNDSTVVVPGLDNPHHISLDQRHLAIANMSAGEVLECDIVDNMATNFQTIRSADGLDLVRPHDVRLTAHLSVIADTGNSRVLFRPRGEDWRAVELERPLAYPGAVCLDDTGFWIADTGNHRVVKFDSGGRQLLSYGGRSDGAAEFDLPVGICRWRDFLFVADEGAERIKVLQVSDAQGSGRTELTPLVQHLAGDFIGQPLGLAVSRNNRLAVSDRKLKCVWLVDLVRLTQQDAAFS